MDWFAQVRWWTEKAREYGYDWPMIFMGEQVICCCWPTLWDADNDNG
jgi:hypothetical protein